jgi:hypothetical protein
MWITFFSSNEEIIRPAASTTQTDAEVAGGCIIENERTNEN